MPCNAIIDGLPNNDQAPPTCGATVCYDYDLDMGPFKVHASLCKAHGQIVEGARRKQERDAV